MRIRAHWVLFGFAIAAAGCTSKDAAPPEQKAEEPAKEAAPAPAAEEPASDPVAEATTIYVTRCTVCHGEKGKGDGAGSAALQPKPRDFTSEEWQASVTDDHLSKIIVYGGASVGMAAIMPANPDLEGKPEVVVELVKYVRGLSGQ